MLFVSSCCNLAVSCHRLIGLLIATALIPHAFSCCYSSFIWLPLPRQFLLQVTPLFVGCEMTFRPSSIHELTRHLARHCSSSQCWWSYYSSGHVSGFLFPLFFRRLQEDHDPKNVLPIRASRALVALNTHPSQVRVMRFQGGSNLWMCSLLLLPLSRYSCSSQAKTKTMAGRICQFCLLLGQSYF